MVDFQNEKLLSNTVKEIIKGDTSTVVQLRNSQGEGSLTIYELCDGLTMMYNDFHMPYCESDLEIKDNIFCIDFCNEGRIEYEREDHTGLMSIFWTQKVKLFHAALLANNSH